MASQKSRRDLEQGAIKCVVEIESYEISLRAHIQEERVVCERSNYTYAADVALLSGQLKVIYSDSNIFIDRTNFTLYKCHLLGAHLNRPDCSLCQRIESRFACAWCSGQCRHKSRCSERPDERCPPPRIDFVHPLSGPALGGTRVTIEGSNLGQSFEEIANRVTIGSVPCRPLEDEYRPSNRIVCLTSALQSARTHPQLDLAAGDIMVGNRAGYSLGPAKFLFKTAYLRDHAPRYGPQSGGTRITLTGLNLDIGSSVQVYLDELPCLVEPNLITSEQLVCRTTASRQASRAIRQLRLVIDEAQIIHEDDVFYYTADPLISKVAPARAYLSGGRPISVSGVNLTVVQQPRMAIHDPVSGRKINESACLLQDDTHMQCPAPAVNLQLMDLELSEQQQQQLQGAASYEPGSSSVGNLLLSGIKQQQPVLQQDESVRFRLSFIMDGVQQTSYPQLQHEIAYTSDPRLYAFASAAYRAAQEAEAATAPPSEQTFQLEADTFLLQPGEPALLLYGEHLRAAVSEYEITVTVGQDLCNLTQLTQTRLACVMPLDHMATPTDEEGHQTARALPLVVVRIGFNLRYELGFVQYHPQLVEQIVALLANGSGPQASNQLVTSQQSSFTSRRLMHPAYPQYMPRESESVLHRISGFLTNLLLLVGYCLTGTLLLGLILVGLRQAANTRHKANADQERRQLLAHVDQLERSLKAECHVASLALQGDLNELERHVDLSGIPLLNSKFYIMKVFFPGMSKHPLLLRAGPAEQQRHQQSGPQLLSGSVAPDFPIGDCFERLLLTKPFLLAFVNTLERQASFTIRDKVNVASLLMIVLMDRLDYATDVMKTLLFQLVERSVEQLNTDERLDFESIEATAGEPARRGPLARKLTRRASNLLNGLPISKRHQKHMGKAVGGSASSLMQSTSVAAQMLLARVAHKTSPLQETADFYNNQQQPAALNNQSSPLDCGLQQLSCAEYMSTTVFNNAANLAGDQMERGIGKRHQALENGGLSSSRQSLGSTLSRSRRLRRLRRAAQRNRSHQAQLMLRRTDSVVEKMLTNWLALNMYDHFQGPAGQALYMLFEALKCQIERGPVDAVSGDAYYSLNEHKLLRVESSNLQFEVVNLYVIVDTDILQPPGATLPNINHNLLLDDHRNLYDVGEPAPRPYLSATLGQRQTSASQQQQQQYTSGNTITLALRVLDCDTINQVKAKILAALYRNSANSCRLSAQEVELSLRQHQPMATNQGAHTLSHQHQQFATIVLSDEDLSSMTSFNAIRRLNTLRHYGVTDQAIMMLKRIAHQTSSQQQQPILADMLDDHYSNPYTEIQYSGQPTSRLSKGELQHSQQHRQQEAAKSWHLIKASHELNRTSAQLSELSNDSSASPASHSPSMMLLGGAHHSQQASMQQLRGAQFYHPASNSSASSAGHALDTHSTSVNSSRLQQHHHHQRHNQTEQQQQPIYCQIGSISAQSQHGCGLNGSSYYSQIGQPTSVSHGQSPNARHNQFQQLAAPSDEGVDVAVLARMLTSKGTVQKYIDDFFRTILTVRPRQQQQQALSTLKVDSIQLYEEAAFSSGLICSPTGEASLSTTSRRGAPTPGACPSAVKWIFDLLDEAAIRNGISDQNVIHAWKSNAFLLRFWVNFVKNPNYILDVDKSSTLDASLSVIAQTLMDSCATGNQPHDLKGDNNRLIFAKDLPKYKELVKRFYQDVASMRPVSDQEMIKQMGLLSSSNAGKFDTNLALKELCVYAVNYGGEIMNTLNGDYACQQLELPQQLEHCFRSFAIFEAY